MPAVVFSDFSGGLDLRQSASMAEAKLQRVLSNCYVTTGKKIRKRPCLTKIATLEVGTVGLMAAGGKLNTFYGPGPVITHADTLFRANRTPHPTNTALQVVDAHYAENFNAAIYAAVEYSDGSIFHHYLDLPGGGTWAALGAYSLGDFVAPTAGNGFRFEATAGGTSGGTEPVWPLAVGSTVADGTVTWTCRSFAITDVNCPHTREVQKLNQKIYAADGGDVAYCKTGDPRDWTTANDAGFIPSSLHAAGSDQVTALGDFRGDLTIFFADSTQLWDVASDPANNALKDVAENIGTLHHDAVQPFANDLVFLAKPGFRSIALTVLTDNLEESDVGGAIDALRGEILNTDNPRSIYYPTLGQLWVYNGAKVYILAYSVTRKISAWGTYTFPFPIEAAAILNGELYLRNGNDVYRADQNAYNDNGIVPLCEVEMYYQDEKTPGILKQFIGFDAVTVGNPDIAFRFDPRNTSLQTQYLPLEGGRTEPVYYLELPGSVGNYASTQNSPAIIGDIDVRVRAALDNYTPASSQVLASKYDAGQVSWDFWVRSDGKLEFLSSTDGVTGSSAVSSVATGLSNGERKRLRATRTVAGLIRFFTSDDGITWVQLGTDVSNTAGAIFAGTAPLRIGRDTANPFAGKFYQLEILDGIDGIPAGGFEPRLIDGNTMKGVMWTDDLWTVHQSGSPASEIGFTNELVLDVHQTLEGDTRPGDLLPLELQAVAIAPIFRHQKDEDFQVELVQAYYENLEPV